MTGKSQAMTSPLSVPTTVDRNLANKPKEEHMLWTISVILIILWLLGLVSNYTMGGYVHILLVIAVIVVLLNLIQGRRRR